MNCKSEFPQIKEAPCYVNPVGQQIPLGPAASRSAHAIDPADLRVAAIWL
jgi:hypothetical protein